LRYDGFPAFVVSRADINEGCEQAARRPRRILNGNRTESGTVAELTLPEQRNSQFTLTINGSDFAPGVYAQWNGAKQRAGHSQNFGERYCHR
jgi:hypothetical protein